MVHQPIKRRGSDCLVVEHLRPSSEGLVGGDHHAAEFVASVDNLEEQVRLLPAQLVVSDFIDKHDVRFLEPSQPPF